MTINVEETSMGNFRIEFTFDNATVILQRWEAEELVHSLNSIMHDQDVRDKEYAS